MTSRGGHGRTPGATDSRQGKARGETYRTQAASGIKGVLLIGLFAVALFAGVAFLADPNLRGWGLGVLGLVVVFVGYRIWRRRRTRTSIDETFTDLSE